MTGTLAVATLNDVDELGFLQQADILLAKMKKIAQRTDLNVVGECTHQFQPCGATAFLLLAESHFCVHTW